MVWELEGPIPTLKMSKTLRDMESSYDRRKLAQGHLARRRKTRRRLSQLRPPSLVHQRKSRLSAGIRPLATQGVPRGPPVRRMRRTLWDFARITAGPPGTPPKGATLGGATW